MKKAMKQSTMVYGLSLSSLLLLAAVFAICYATFYSDVLNDYTALLQMATFAAIGLVCAMQLFTLFVIRSKILKPVSEIQEEMEDIAGGQVATPFDMVSDTSEIGRLVEAIHTVRHTLQTYIGDISQKMDELAKGNLDVTIDLEYIGDFRPIQLSMESTLKALNETCRNITIASAQVKQGAEMVASGAQTLAAGSTEQAATIEQLGASVAEVSRQAEENAVTVRNAALDLEQAARGVQNSNDHMRQLTEAMNEIDVASGQIVSVTKAIEDIAFQTNILALNAAVEAARAGNAGKGFAVVADEVRNLAAKSAEAAQQTAQLIQNAVSSVAKGGRITEETAAILAEMHASTDRVTQSFGQIEQATARQVSSIEEIQRGLDQVSAVVQTNAATAEENSATSEQMTAQAALLEESVSKFHLKEDGPATSLSGQVVPSAAMSHSSTEAVLLSAGSSSFGKY